MADTTVGSAYAVVVTTAADPMQVEGLEWERAVEYLPSIDSQAMQTWVRTQECRGHTSRFGVVIPGPQRRVESRHPYREVCVPSAEYQLFSAAVRTNVRPGTADTEEGPYHSALVSAVR